MVKKTIRNGWGLFNIVNALASAVTTPWWLVMSFISGVVVWISKFVFNFVHQDQFVYGVGTMLAVLWTIIGIKTLAARPSGRPVSVEPVVHYEYGLSPEGLIPIFGKFPATHPDHPNEDALNILCNFRNVLSSPVKIKIAEARVIIDSRTCDDSPHVETIIPRLSAKGIQAAGVLMDPTKKVLNGTISMDLHYGPVDGEFVRSYSFKLAINIQFDDTRTGIGVGQSILEEKDQSL